MLPISIRAVFQGDAAPVPTVAVRRKRPPLDRADIDPAGTRDQFAVPVEQGQRRRR